MPEANGSKHESVAKILIGLLKESAVECRLRGRNLTRHSKWALNLIPRSTHLKKGKGSVCSGGSWRQIHRTRTFGRTED